MNIDKYQQSMENWKKQIIIDSHLNALFDSQMTPEEFLNSKILPLPHEDIVKSYMKLTSLRQAITKNMQKEIEVCHPTIEQSFQECLRSKSAYEQIDQQNIRDSLKQIQRFNEKYQLISDRVTEIRNINKILHFSKALQKFKVNARLLKSLMKDFDQSANSHFQSELLNTLKISKIIKEISAITIRFDFSGIKSFEEERIFLNNTKGAMFGLIEKELTAALSKIPGVQSSKRAELEKDIMGKFMILNNIAKLKDFCIPFYKNTLKEMSELLKKSLVIGQSADENDPKNYLQTFEEYFTVSLKKRLIENGIIFIVIDQLLSKSGMKTPFTFNFFDKYWQNVTGFMKDLISWSIDNDAKECSKEKLSENLYESFHVLQTKKSLSKYLMAIVWKYPIVYETLTSICNEVHLYIIKHAQIYHYDFALLKEKLMKVLIPLAQLYYKNAKNLYGGWMDKVTRFRVNIENEIEVSSDYLLKRSEGLFDYPQTSKYLQNIDQSLKIVEWMVFGLKTKEIYQFHMEAMLSIMDEYFKIIHQAIKAFDLEKHSRQDLDVFLNRCDSFINKVKNVLQRGKLGSENVFEPDFIKIELTHGILASTAQAMLSFIRRFMGYSNILREGREKIK